MSNLRIVSTNPATPRFADLPSYKIDELRQEWKDSGTIKSFVEWLKESGND